MKQVVWENDQRNENNGGKLTPTQVLALGFAGVILLGTLLLMLPIATKDGNGAPFLNAIFTATSAVCVTGLVVVDTGTYYSYFGQGVILLLIEVGGLGFMTFATLLAIILGRKITLKERILLQEALNQFSLEGIVRLTKYVLQISVVIQLTAALVLALRWATDLGWKKGLYFGLFHAISAYNNAGFDVFGGFQSLTNYTGDLITNVTVMILIILGGLGFVVLSELYVHRGTKLNLHSRLVLLTSFLLIGLGTLVVYVLEYTNPHTLAPMEPFSKFLASLFQAITPRTAGFNTLDIGQMRETTLLFLIMLMFIGASPGSTGGGIKTTTFLSVVLSVVASFQGKSDSTILERTIPRDLIQKALTITILALLLVLVVTGILTLTEDEEFLPLLFEATSAFATVGLSMGVTPQLSTAGKVSIIFTMYVGRVGPLTLAFALAQKRKVSLAHIRYPEERIIIG